MRKLYAYPPKWARADIDKFSLTTNCVLNVRNVRKFSIFLNKLGIKSFSELRFEHINEYWNAYGKSDKTIMQGLEPFLILFGSTYNFPEYLHITVNRTCSRYVFSEQVNLDELLQYEQNGPNASELISMLEAIKDKVESLNSDFNFAKPENILYPYALFLETHKLRFSFEMAVNWLLQIHNRDTRKIPPAKNVFRVTDLMVRKIEISAINMKKHLFENYKRKKYPLLAWIAQLRKQYLIERNQNSQNCYKRNYKQENAFFMFSEFLKSHDCLLLNEITADLINKFIDKVNAIYKRDKNSNYIIPCIRDFFLFLIVNGQFSLNLFLHCFSISHAKYFNLKMQELSINYGESAVATFIRNKSRVALKTKNYPQWGITILDELECSIVRNSPKKINGLNEDKLRKVFRKMILLLEHQFHPCSVTDLKPSILLMLKDFFCSAYFYAFIFVITERLFPKFYTCLTKSACIDYSFVREKLPNELNSINGQWTSSQVYEKKEDLTLYLRRLSYKIDNVQSARLAINCISILCFEHNLLFNKEVGYIWSKLVKKKYPKTNFAFNVGIYILDCLLKGEQPNKEDIVNERCRLLSKTRNYPFWSRDLIDRFIQNIKSDYLGKSSIDQHHSALLRFTAFLSSCGCCSFDLITPEILKKFDEQDKHLSREGKANVNRKLTNFLIFLASNGIIEYQTVLALPTSVAHRNRPLQILNKKQISFIQNYVESASDLFSLRGSLAALLSLHMGLRGTDIKNLKLTDFNFSESKITLIQNKTKVEISIPILEEIESVLFAYLQTERRDHPDVNVMLAAKAPYNKLRCNPLNILIKKLIKLGCEPFLANTLRRTFASLMLEGGADFLEIASALGHSGIKSVDHYISANQNKINQCYLSGKNFVYGGDDL